MRAWIGCSGWQYPEWDGNFYPEDLAKSQWFKFYLQHFNSVEINYSFYHNVSEKNLINWCNAAPEHFRYSIKVHRLITHYKKFNQTEILLKEFYAKLLLLENKLGCVLFQMPSNLHFSLEKLELILSQLDLHYTNVLEFRHASWWREEVFQLLKQHHVIFCSIDAPQLPQDLITTQQQCYLRFHGKPKWYYGNYSKVALAKWQQQMQQQSVKEAWVYFNNTASGHAPYNALELKKYLSNK